MEGVVLFEDLAVTTQDCGSTAFGAQSIPQYADPTDCFLSSRIHKFVSGTMRMATSVPTRHFQG